MPQPALHVLIGAELLHAWRSDPSHALLDPFDDDVANAFLVGTLGPDLGLFPGGAPAVSRLAHTQRSGDLARALFAHARNDVERAFAWGWLSHITADVAIHPLVNDAAAAYAHRLGLAPTLADHVRVEVGLDAWFAWRHPLLRPLRFRPALDRRGWQFVAASYAAVHAHRITPGQLLQMQRGLLRFTRLAVHFAAVARHLCWDEPDGAELVPAATAVLWRLVTAVSAPDTTVHAYLNPVRPDEDLVASVARGMQASRQDFDHYARGGLRNLPDFNLETGALQPRARSVA